MSRASTEPLRALLALALALGVAQGTLEVAARVTPRAGLTGPELATFLMISVGLSLGLTLGLALAARLLRPVPMLGARPFGLVLAGVLGLQTSANYRFEVVLNEFVRDPKVWGGILACLLGSLVVGLALDGLLRRPRVPAALLGLAAVGVGLGFVRGQPHQGVAASGPSVLLISMDTTRDDHLSPYGYAVSTPHLQALADQGARFTQAIAAAPVTEPSHLAMLSGVAPYRSGVLANGTDLGDRPLLVTRTLQDAGWLTAGFVAGFPLHSKYGWTQGADVWDDDFGAVAGLQSLSLIKAWNQVALKDHALRERSAARVLARAVPWLRAHRDQQFFAFVHFYDAHGPYESAGNAALGPPPTSGPPLALPAYWPPFFRAITDPKWLIRAYDAEIETVDDAVGQLVEALGPRLDQTIVIVTADHGESLTEHDYLFDHGDNLYDPSLRVPWIVRYPAAVKAGLAIDCQVGGVDVAPTVLALAGVPDTEARDGVSRAPELGGEPCRARPVVSSTVSGRMVAPPPIDHALRDGGWKYILRANGDPLAFDLRSDPGELVPAGTSAVTDHMGGMLRSWVQSGAPAVVPTLDAEDEEALKQLGYLQ